MRKRLAVFDIDGTILKSTSAEKIFFRFLLSRGELHLAEGINFARRFLATFPRSWVLATKGNRSYLKGKDCDHVGMLADECFRNAIIPRILETAQKMIKKHKSNGFEIVLLSGTPDFLVHRFQEYLGADHAHGSTLEILKGRYTGNHVGLFPYGQAKAEIIKVHYGRDPYDLSVSHAYADHISDFEFLRLFGYPTIVNPSSQLAAKAKEFGIKTMYF